MDKIIDWYLFIMAIVGAFTTLGFIFYVLSHLCIFWQPY